MSTLHADGGDVLVAIDVGTSGARASAFDLAGTPIAQVRQPYPTALPAEGWAEQDARRWQTASVSALAGLVRTLGPRHPVAAIGITGQCPSVVPVDAAGTPLRPGIIYRDNRAIAEADEMRERFGAREVHALTGHVPAAFHVAAKILWIRAHEPEVFAATRRFLQPSDCVNAAIPILLAFIVLYRSAWHEGLRRGARALLVAATSCAIFSAVALGTLLAAVLAALTYASNFDRFLAFHY